MEYGSLLLESVIHLFIHSIKQFHRGTWLLDMRLFHEKWAAVPGVRDQVSQCFQMPAIQLFEMQGK